VRANGLDRTIISGGTHPKIGIVTAGKSYLDTRQALDELGINEVRANELGLRLYKVAMTWPLEPEGIEKFAQGLDLILVIEEKRALVETQVKEQLFDWSLRPQVLGKRDEAGNWLFPATGALKPLDIAIAVGERLLGATFDERLATRLHHLKTLKDDLPVHMSAITRTAYFWIMGPVIGICLGSTWTTSRPLLTTLAPRETLGQFFGLYALSGRTAAIIGPLLWGGVVLYFKKDNPVVIGIINSLEKIGLTFSDQVLNTIQYRFGIFVLILLMIVGLLIFIKVPDKKMTNNG